MNNGNVGCGGCVFYFVIVMGLCLGYGCWYLYDIFIWLYGNKLEKINVTKGYSSNLFSLDIFWEEWVIN